MLGLRPDGKKAKDIDPIFCVIPHIMKKRSDSQVFFKIDIPIESMENYINQKLDEGIKMSYMNIIYAAIVRLLNDRPQLNRFVMNGRLYDRKELTVSLVIKKSLSDSGKEMTTKVKFTGKETIFDVKEKLDAIIAENKEDDASNGTDKFAKLLSYIPSFILKGVVNLIRFLDRHGLLPKFIIDLSPFHTSAFLTNVGSLGIDYIYHHLYDFGTTSLFLAMGKKKQSYIYEDDEIKKMKCISLGFVGDERICDGYYYANSLKALTRLLKKPELVEISPEAEQEKGQQEESEKVKQ